MGGSITHRTRPSQQSLLENKVMKRNYVFPQVWYRLLALIFADAGLILSSSVSGSPPIKESNLSVIAVNRLRIFTHLQIGNYRTAPDWLIPQPLGTSALLLSIPHYCLPKPTSFSIPYPPCKGLFSHSLLYSLCCQSSFFHSFSK